MGNKQSVSEGEDDTEDKDVGVGMGMGMGISGSSTNLNNNGAPEEMDDEVELPPPMKPIQEPLLVPNSACITASKIDLNDNVTKRVSVHIVYPNL